MFGSKWPKLLNIFGSYFFFFKYNNNKIKTCKNVYNKKCVERFLKLLTKKHIIVVE